MRKRTIKKNFWFNYEEDRRLKYLSSISNLSEANIIRKLLYDTVVKESPPIEFYSAIDKINKIGVNINQIARIANTTGNIYEESLNNELEKLDILRKDLYRKYL